MDVRDAEEIEVDRLARVWYDGWHESHAPIVPAELTRLRTLESFRQRLQEDLLNVRVVGPAWRARRILHHQGCRALSTLRVGTVTGLGRRGRVDCGRRGPAGRRGVETAWLACAIGNERAARFYEKCGWHRVGTMANRLDTSIGQFPLEVWRYEKSLKPQLSVG